jgi:hypothetical protein
VIPRSILSTVFDCRSSAFKSPNLLHLAYHNPNRVKPPEDSKYEYENRLQDLEEELSTRLSAQEFVATINAIGYARLNAQWARNLIEQPMRYTLQEIAALDYLRLKNSEHTPKLLATARLSVSQDYDKIAMPGGYMICILMTKLPGDQLDYDKFWKALIEEREQVRKAFKTALTYVRPTAH